VFGRFRDGGFDCLEGREDGADHGDHDAYSGTSGDVRPRRLKCWLEREFRQVEECGQAILDWLKRSRLRGPSLRQSVSGLHCRYLCS